ncbi:copper resistance CopC family protein [Aeromicrobium sp. 179-A 4D2 NHS]|uniref:copper resistance CopC family protein n=1 Tax=Aeromicrobium sp. 179-A 4D2 NHS TaxID=3142375 RepID=UPI0039A0DA0A
MRLIRVLLLVVIVVLGSAWPAAAHTALVSTDPADGARLDTAPDRIVLTFNEPVRPLSDASLQVDGTAQEADVRIDGPRLVLTPSEAFAGSYEINYRVISADGHPVSGSTAFAVVGEGVKATGAKGATAQDDEGGVPVALWGALGAVVVLGIAAFAVVSLRGRASR